MLELVPLVVTVDAPAQVDPIGDWLDRDAHRVRLAGLSARL